MLDLVAVDVDVGEAVVAAEVLLLPERRQQRPVVPQPQVVDRRLVFVEDPAGELLLTGEGARLDRVEVERRARRLHVVPDVGPLDGQLVRLDLEALDEARIEASDDDREHEPGAGGEPEQPQRPEPGVQEQEPGRDEGDDGEDHVGRVLRVHVGVQRGLDVAVPPASRVRQLRDVELVAGGDDDQQERADDREVPPDGRREVELPAERAGGIRRERQHADDDQRRRGPAEHEAPEGQVEDVEADVSTEGRVGGAPCARH